MMTLVEEETEQSSSFTSEPVVISSENDDLRSNDVATSIEKSTFRDDDNHLPKENELLWEELMGKDLLLKSIHIPDSNSPAVQPQDAVIVDFVGRCVPDHILNENCNFDDNNDDTINPIFHVAHDWLVVIGEKDVIPVLEMGIRFMQEGQVCFLYSTSKYAYGSAGRKYTNSSNNNNNNNNSYTLPPNSNVMYKVTVKQIIPAHELEKRSFQVTLCESKKKIGNDVYQNELLLDHTTTYARNRTIALYKRAVEMLDFMLTTNTAATTTDDNDDEQQQEITDHDDDENDETTEFDKAHATSILLDCLNNITAVHLACKEYHLAKFAAVNVLLRDPNNVKGLVRAAKASLLDPASSYEEVEASIQAAISVLNDIQQQQHSKNNNNNDSDVVNQQLQQEIEKIQNQFVRQKQQYKQRQKEMQSNIRKGLQNQKQRESNLTTNTEDDSNKQEEIHFNRKSMDTADANESNENIIDVRSKAHTKDESEKKSDGGGGDGVVHHGNEGMVDVKKKNFISALRSYITELSVTYPNIKSMILTYSFQLIITIIMIIYFKYNAHHLVKEQVLLQSEEDIIAVTTPEL